VDNKTAAKLNEVLKSLGAFFAYAVYGIVLKADSTSRVGYTVVAFDKDIAGEDRLGEAITNADGSYSITYTEEQFQRSENEKGGADLFVRILTQGGESLFQSKTNRNAPPELRLDVNLPTAAFVVRGTVREANGNPALNIIVRAFDVDLRRQELLGETSINEVGYYEIGYSYEKFSNAEKGNADLLVRVSESVSANEEKLLAESDIYFNATNVQEINFPLPLAPAEKEKSEWERVNELVLPLLKGQKETVEKKLLKKKQSEIVFVDLLPGELKPDDFDFISKETGLDRSNIQLWSLAYNLNIGVNSIASELFYGWFRMGLPTEVKDLWARTTDELQQKLKEAVDKNIIPAIIAGMEKIVAAINNSCQDFQLQPAKSGEKPSLGDVLNTAGKDWLSDEKKKRYIDIVKGLDPDAQEYFNKKVDAIGFTSIEKITLQKTLRIDKLTLSHPPLMEALHNYVKSDTDASLKPLAIIHNDQWIDLAYTHGVPTGSMQAPEDYAMQLANGVEDRLPAASLANKISNEEILFNQPGINKLTQFLNPANDFDIVNGDIKSIISDRLDDESKGLLKKLQNLKKLGAR